MKLNLIIHRAVFKEFIPPFIINLLFFSFIFLMARLLEITNLVVNYSVKLSSIFLMLVFTLPDFLIYVVPMSTMIAILLTFLRMSADNEIVALKSSGISIIQLLPPVIIFGIIASFFTGYISVYGRPAGRRALKNMMIDIASSHINIGLKERVFNDKFKGVMLYVDHIEPGSDRLDGVFIEDRRKKDLSVTIIAPKGRMNSDPDKLEFILRLYNGSILQVDVNKRTTNLVKFETYDLKLELGKILKRPSATNLNEKEMSIGQLTDYIHNAKKKDMFYYKAKMEFHRKFAIPFACIILGFLALPLGIQAKFAKPRGGFILGFLTFLLYYLIQTAAIVFGEAGRLPAIYGMWAPNIIIFLVAIYLFYKTLNEKMFRDSFIFNFFHGIFFRIMTRVKKSKSPINS